MEIPQSVLEDFLEPYSSSARYLRSARNTDARFEGTFSIVQSSYLRPGISAGHLNAVDALICFNQLIYVGIGNGIREMILPGLEGVSYEVFKEKSIDGLIYALDHVRFRKPIDAREFSGNITMMNLKRRGDAYFMKVAYDFESKAGGEVGLAMRIMEKKGTS